jgi:hypothetical protein
MVPNAIEIAHLTCRARQRLHFTRGPALRGMKNGPVLKRQQRVRLANHGIRSGHH